MQVLLLALSACAAAPSDQLLVLERGSCSLGVASPDRPEEIREVASFGNKQCTLAVSGNIVGREALIYAGMGAEQRGLFLVNLASGGRTEIALPPEQVLLATHLDASNLVHIVTRSPQGVKRWAHDGAVWTVRGDVADLPQWGMIMPGGHAPATPAVASLFEDESARYFPWATPASDELTPAGARERIAGVTCPGLPGLIPAGDVLASCGEHPTRRGTPVVIRSNEGVIPLEGDWNGPDGPVLFDLRRRGGHVLVDFRGRHPTRLHDLSGAGVGTFDKNSLVLFWPLDGSNAPL